MTVIFDWKDKRAMLECLTDSVHDLRLCLDGAGSLQLEAVGGDLTAAIDKLYTIMERSLAKDAEDLDV